MQTLCKKVSKTEAIEIRTNEKELITRGYVRLRKEKPTQVFRLKTRKKYRNQGYGTQLMQEIIKKKDIKVLEKSKDLLTPNEYKYVKEQIK